MRVYISGAMTGVPGYERAFAKAEEELRAKGHDAVNPARLADIVHTDMSSEEWLSVDLALLRVCDAIYMLKGWQDSRGANRELGFALGAKMKVMYEEERK